MSLATALPDSLAATRPVQVLERSLQRGRLAHALLLHGDDLRALETVALALAGALLGSTGDVRNHPDFFTLRPRGKARKLRIGEQGKDEPNTMRWLLPRLMRSAHQGGRKVAIIYECDRMNDATANACLKTLEEPPADTTLLLLTTRPYDLLTTIRSRCFNFRLSVKLEDADDPRWRDWCDDYAAWLAFLHDPESPPRAKIGTAINAYGLIARFQRLLKDMADEAWKAEKGNRPENLSDDEIDALETEIRKGIRARLWREIEHATREFALDTGEKTGTLPSRELTHTIAALEKSAGLLELNLNDGAAIEAFLLSAMRTWFAAR